MLDKVTQHAAVALFGFSEEQLETPVDRRLIRAIKRAAKLRRDLSGPLPLRDQLEALVLVPIPPAAIAERLGIRKSVEHAYERLYYDVRRRGRSFIQHGIVVSPSWRPFSVEEPDRILKHFAWHHGPHVYDAISAYFLNRHRFDDWMAEAHSDEERLNRLETRTAVSAACLYGNREPAEDFKLLRFYLLHRSGRLDGVALAPEVPGFPYSAGSNAMMPDERVVLEGSKTEPICEVDREADPPDAAAPRGCKSGGASVA